MESRWSAPRRASERAGCQRLREEGELHPGRANPVCDPAQTAVWFELGCSAFAGTHRTVPLWKPTIWRESLVPNSRC